VVLGQQETTFGATDLDHTVLPLRSIMTE
jgi:hypothetical protein